MAAAQSCCRSWSSPCSIKAWGSSADVVSMVGEDVSAGGSESREVAQVVGLIIHASIAKNVQAADHLTRRRMVNHPPAAGGCAQGVRA